MAPPLAFDASRAEYRARPMKAQDIVTFSGKKQDNGPISIIRNPANPRMLNENGFVKAGHVLQLIDIGGSEPAFRHVGPDKTVVTASVDRTDFKEPIRAWEMIRLESRLVRTWDTSMETQVKVLAEDWRTGTTRHVATAHLVFVALDRKTRQKTAVPEYKPKTYEERMLAKAADIRKENRKKEGKVAPFIPIDAATDDVTLLTREMTEKDANAQDNVFGGIILEVIDQAGAAAAKKQALNGDVVGVRLDRMSFIAPTFIGETVEARAIVTKTWKTSMEVQVEVDAVNPNTGDRRKVASSYVVYVRLGNKGKPAEVPPYIPKTELQKKRAEAADRRREIRKQEEAESGREIPASITWMERAMERTKAWLASKF